MLVENVHLIVRRGVDVVATRIAATVLAVDHHCRDNDGSVTMNHQRKKPTLWEHHHHHHHDPLGVVVLRRHHPFEDKPIPGR